LASLFVSLIQHIAEKVILLLTAIYRIREIKTGSVYPCIGNNLLRYNNLLSGLFSNLLL